MKAPARRAAAAALVLAVLCAGRVAGGTRAAALGIEVPTLGLLPDYMTDEAMLDIRDNLHAEYVRTGWIPDWIYREQRHHRAWRQEDRTMHEICKFGLRMMVIVPGPRNDARGEDDLLTNVEAFFTRYQRREPGCIRWAEIANEADLPANGFQDVTQYAHYYARVAPIVASFGVPVITTGISGFDRPWTAALADLLGSMPSPPPLAGYGFHPYGTPAGSLKLAVDDLRYDGRGRDVYVTEIGRSKASELYDTIVALAHVTPAITIYTYRAAPRENPQYSLTDNPELYAAVQRAWADALATPRAP
ncbi:MAG: hypothetical protein JO175_02315 [Candidatus Eremiobacteraeota bacterium]|nr:hypothetical protein [Candidatus Eremiobacteraeota bacterium]